jgi:hypothetical protein
MYKAVLLFNTVYRMSDFCNNLILFTEGGDQSPDLDISEIEDYGSLDGMKVGPVSTGELGPFSSVKLEIIWQPHIPGKVVTEFLISFSDPLSESVSNSKKLKCSSLGVCSVDKIVCRTSKFLLLYYVAHWESVV